MTKQRPGNKTRTTPDVTKHLLINFSILSISKIQL